MGEDGKGTTYWYIIFLFVYLHKVTSIRCIDSFHLLISRYDGDSTIGHRLYKEITKVEFMGMKGIGRLIEPTNSYQWETLATNLEEFQQTYATYGDPECIIITEVESIKQIGLQIDPD
ncbi:hypothetical protein GIB67_009032 [Kingdonia uniflora]|uniref:Uncharacterized protein n=1 Tax=Kingdonia uniflora TaxID=39325 RepID=A0A7J7LVT2_9MAGN|nr:hypothetical protein GIB67_009032 [Kingdonia uniflora]